MIFRFEFVELLNSKKECVLDTKYMNKNKLTFEILLNMWMKNLYKLTILKKTKILVNSLIELQSKINNK